MKKTTMVSGVGLVFVAAFIVFMISSSFAQGSKKSEVLDLEDRIQNTEKRIEQYKGCIAQQRPGEIILYQDPKTSDCMVITTGSLKEYFKEKGLTPSEIQENLARWDESSSEVKKRLEKDIVAMGSELYELRDNLAKIRKEGGPTGTTGLSAAVRFDYVGGRAEADGREAELHLIIDGSKVQGDMTARSVCEIGIRLPKTQISFQGDIDGPWEDKKSLITADWTGGDYGCDGGLMREYPQEGTLTIQMRREANSDASDPRYVVFLKRIASSPYGFVFKPLGKTNKPETPQPGEGSFNISGVWKEESTLGTWTFSPLDNNRYKAHFKGEVVSDGLAVIQGNQVVIDIQVDKYHVHYELVVSSDGKKAVGHWTSSNEQPVDTVLVYQSGGPIVSKELTYTGVAAMDDRPATVTFKIVGNDVTGRAEIGSICQQNIHLGGASITFSGKLAGTWESKTGSIDGTWEGTDHMCGKDMPNSGSFKLFYKDEVKPVIHFRLKGERGQYGYNLTPHNTVYASGDATPPGTDPDKPTKPTPTDKPIKPPTTVTPDDLDKDQVAQILSLPEELVAAPGTQTGMPGIYAVMKDTGEQLKLDPDSLKWEHSKGIEFKDGAIVISDKAKTGDILLITVTAKIGMKAFTTEVKIRVVEDAKTGTYSGKVYFTYSPLLQNKAGFPSSPAWAEVELRNRLGSGGVYDKTVTGPSGEFVFKNVPRGYYKAWAVKIAPTQFPDGYELRNPTGPWTRYWGDMPEMKWSDEAAKQVETWDVANKGVPVEAIQPKTAGSMSGKVYGRVTHNGKAVPNMKVMADIDGGGAHYQTLSDRSGDYVIDLNPAGPGSYWIQAEKYITPGWARCGDLLDTASSKHQRAVMVQVPVTSFNGEKVDIEVETRKEIFGECSDEEPPVSPDVEDRQRRGN